MAASDSEDFESADEDLEVASSKLQEKGVEDLRKKQIQACNESKLSEKLARSHVGAGDTSQFDKPIKSKNNEELKVNNRTIDIGGNDPIVVALKSLKIADETEKAGETDKLSEQNACEERDDIMRRGQEISSNAANKVKNTEPESSKCSESVIPSEVSCEGMEFSEDGAGAWEDELGELDIEEEQQIVESPRGGDIGSVLDKLAGSATQKETSSSSGWSGWGGWGVSLLSTATESVSTLTGHVSHVLETGLGAPDPEELARLDHEQEQALLEQLKEKPVSEQAEHEEMKPEENSSGGLFGFGRVMSGVTSITKLVETAGSKVVTGGLDTLESIGKKTMEVLQEGDPGLKKKRALFTEKILLSQILREAKEKAEHDDKELLDKEAARKAHFETLFDDYQGLVHLEALEMLSKQCDLKLQSILLTIAGQELFDLQQTLTELKEQCQLPDEEDVEDCPVVNQREKLAQIGKGLGVHVATDKLTKTWDETEQWLENCRTNQESTAEDTAIACAREIHQKAMATLARLTAESVEQFHKAAELLLVLEKRNPSEEAAILLDMTSVLCSQVSAAATRFSECLNVSPENSIDPEAVNNLITNVFLEAAHSSSYIQEAFQLLIPVLQVGINV